MIMMDQKMKQLPDKPGVYIFQDDSKEVLYVGKAASLKKRVRSYFNSTQYSAKIKILTEKVKHVDYIVTDSEVEALILECSLIKKHSPRYNSMLKDDKTYPYIKVTCNEPFPRIETTREIKGDGARYFGPYISAGDMHETFRLVKKIFMLRTCRQLKKKDSPCLNYHIKRCAAPCADKISQEKYREKINEVIMFLEGRQEKLVGQLEKNMHEAAENLEYEKAAELKKQLEAVKKVLVKQKVVSSSQDSYDVIALACGEKEACVQIFFVRKGKVTGKKHFFMEKIEYLSSSEVLSSFIKQYYAVSEELPSKLVVQEEVEEKELMEKWLSHLKGVKVAVQVPKRGSKVKLVNLVAKNALISIQEREAASQKAGNVLKLLQKELALKRLPVRIECFDISNTGGSKIVGSMAVYENGEAKKRDYRRYMIAAIGKKDDYASIKEIVYRRFKNYTEETKSSVKPDLILIDGGRGHLNTAKEVLNFLSLHDIEVASIAKKEELVFKQEDPAPIRLTADNEALHLLQRIRDEAHRFAVSYHRLLRSKEIKTSILDEIPGIGPARKKALLKCFGSVTNIKKASFEELLNVEGIDKRSAQHVYNYFSSK